MADNSKSTLLKRRAVQLGSVSKFQLPSIPDFYPEQMVRRFPELRMKNEELKSYFQKLNTALEQTVAGKTQE